MGKTQRQGGNCMVSKQVLPTVASAMFLFIPFASHAEAISSSLAEVNGTKLYYEVKGQSHLIVFIHGGLISSSEWNKQFTPFAER